MLYDSTYALSAVTRKVTYESSVGTPSVVSHIPMLVTSAITVRYHYISAD